MINPHMNANRLRGNRQPSQPREHAFEEVGPVERSNERLQIEDLRDVRLGITAELGSCTMLVREVLKLERGSVVQLHKLAGEMSDIYVNDLPMARGEVVVIGDTLHVRIGEIIGVEEKAEALEHEEIGRAHV